MEEGDCFQGSDPGLTTDPKTEGHCSWKSNLCHDFEYKDDSRTGWVSHESHRSIVVTLYEEDHALFSKDDIETMTLSPAEWYSDTCETYEIRLAREFKPEKEHLVCWSLTAGVEIEAAALEAGVLSCTSWASPPESWTYLMEVTPLANVEDERDDLEDREEGGECFSGMDTVVTESGQNVPIRDIRVGDKVLTSNQNGDLSYSPVVYIPHGPNDVNAEFVRIATDLDKVLHVTKMHLLRTCDNDQGDTGTKRAIDLQVGECLLTIDGEETIASLDLRAHPGGIYTVVTANEYLVVGGVVASPFAYFHKPVHYYYNLHRTIYSYAPHLLKSTNFESASVSSFFSSMAEALAALSVKAFRF